MAQTNVLLLSQIAGYVMALIISLCIAVPMGMHEDEFGNHCLLFSSGQWQAQDGQLSVNWASLSYCNYVIVVGLIMFIISCIQIYRLSMFAYTGTDSTFLSAFIEAVGCAAVCALAVSAAIIVSLGYMRWCDLILQRFNRCEDAAGPNILTEKSIVTKGFNIEMGTAQGFSIMFYATCTSQ